MPELPEVETTCRGILPYIKEQTITDIIIRQPKLRWLTPPEIHEAKEATIKSVKRRGKYILLEVASLQKTIGTVIIHLGMSGSLRVIDTGLTPEKHDHIDLIFNNGKAIRLRDPRRFGAVLWTNNNPLKHKLLRSLGPEPLDQEFNASH